jgi:hypothetical protein
MLKWYTALNIPTQAGDNSLDAEVSTRSQVIEIVKRLCTLQDVKNANGNLQPASNWEFIAFLKSVSTKNQVVNNSGLKPITYETLTTTTTIDPNINNLTLANTQRGSFFTPIKKFIPEVYTTSSSVVYSNLLDAAPNPTTLTEINPDKTYTLYNYQMTTTPTYKSSDPKTGGGIQVLKDINNTRAGSTFVVPPPSWIVLRSPPSMSDYLPKTKSLYMVVSFEYPATLTLPAVKGAPVKYKAAALKNPKLPLSDKNPLVPGTTGLYSWDTKVEINNTARNSICIYYIIADTLAGEDYTTVLDSIGVSTAGVGDPNTLISYISSRNELTFAILPSLVDNVYQTNKYIYEDLNEVGVNKKLVWAYQLNMPFYKPAKGATEGQSKIHMSMDDRGFFWAVTSGINSTEFDFGWMVIPQSGINRPLNNKNFDSNQGPGDDTTLTTFVGNVANLNNINSITGECTVTAGRKDPFKHLWSDGVLGYPLTYNIKDSFGSSFRSVLQNGNYVYWLPTAPLQFGVSSAKEKFKALAENLSVDVIISNSGTNSDNTAAYSLQKDRVYNTFPVYMFDWCDTLFDFTGIGDQDFIRGTMGLTGILSPDFYWGSNKVPHGTINTSAEGEGHMAVGCFWFPVSTFRAKANLSN